jgi:hypothetical protein
MRTLSKLVLVVALAAGTVFAGNAWATPVTFTPGVSGSSVSVYESVRLADLTANLVLSGDSFTLGDGFTQTLDFFTLSASGLAWNRDYTVAATLAFLAPPIAASGTGGGKFFTALGILSAGTLTWDPATLPDTFLLADGNSISINFQGGSVIGVGNPATTLVHAYVTNNGGAVSPVPEPGTIMLLGAGLLGLAFCGRRWMK